MAMHGCAACLKQPREIDRLTEAIQGLRHKRRYQERRANEGLFGSATSSAKRPVKANTPSAPEPRRKGARPGHLGVGRQAVDASQAERVVEVAAEVGERCPDGDALLEEKGTDSRLVLDSRPVKAERVRSRRPKPYGPRCRRPCQPRAPAVLPKSLYGTPRIATATTMHSRHGMPLGRVCEQTGLGPGSLVEICHRLARLCAGIPDHLIAEYR
jgi:transposase